MDAQAEDEYRQFLAARSTALYRAAFLLTGQREAAEDLLQTALVKTIGRWKRLDQPEAYVRKVMYHHQISKWRLRSWGKVRSSADLPEIADAGDAFARADLRLSLEAALRLLSPGQRAVLVMRFFDDLPESEVAAILGVSVGTVRTQCHRALRRLRERCPELTTSNTAEGAPS